MSLVASGNNSTHAATDPVLENVAFWPDIEVSAFRDVERMREEVPTPRLVHALSAAMADINRQLADWMQHRVDAGHTTHRALPITAWQRATHYADLYRRAVYALAHADLLERYVDYSATNTGDERAQAKEAAVDDYRRASRWAVSEIEGRTHSTVELI